MQFTHDTILLVQPMQDPRSRRYWPYHSLTACLEGLCGVFEEYLKLKAGSEVATVKYELRDVMRFIDDLPDLACLVRNQEGQYIPKCKDWVKTKIYYYLYNLIADKDNESRGHSSSSSHTHYFNFNY